MAVLTEMPAPDKIAERMRLIWESPYIPQDPHPRQSLFLANDDMELLYGGAAGGGKSSALLMSALMFAHVPNYSALILRLSMSDLDLADAIMNRSRDWLSNTDAIWREKKATWYFPGGASLTFGFLKSEKDKYRYMSAQFQFIGFDELTQFPESLYTYMASRLRRLEGMEVPLRMRGATNPGGEGHYWVYERFVAPYAPYPFIPAKLSDNPSIDEEEYLQALERLDPLTRDQLLAGRWITDATGQPFPPWFWRGRNRYEYPPYSPVARYLFFDTAEKADKKHAYTAWVAFDVLPDYRVAVRSAGRRKVEFYDLTALIETIARESDLDGKLRGVVIEDRSSGTQALQTLRASGKRWLAKKLVAWSVGNRSKEESWALASVWCKKGCVLLPHPSADTMWLHDFENEICNVPNTAHKDQADAFALGILYLENFMAAHLSRHRAAAKVA